MLFKTVYVIILHSGEQMNWKTTLGHFKLHNIIIGPTFPGNEKEYFSRFSRTSLVSLLL